MDIELVTNISVNFFFTKNCANTETHTFDIYAIQIFDEENNYSFLALL